MCGRVNISDHEGLRALLAMMGLRVWPMRAPQFNVAPSATIEVITLADDGHTLALKDMHWGFVNSNRHINSRLLVNARSETVFHKPSFRSSALNTRAIVPVNGFYEWRTSDDGQKQAFYIAHADSPAMALAAIFQPSTQAVDNAVGKSITNKEQTQMSLGFPDEEIGVDNNSAQPRTTENRHRPDNDVCLLTMPANQQMSSVHKRMPLILDPLQAQRWLCDGTESLLESYCGASENTLLSIRQVDGFVNNAANDGPQCLVKTFVSTKRR